ncbi:probable cytochrome P450 313a4 [Drosophila montana]|uniref:probable cytochrome P450 313a4 n=1 Tax=Drosophila montana TaxID=40370 RepID=UPI00313DF132
MNLILLILCLVLLTLLGTYYLWSRREFYKFFAKFPGPLGYPLIGIAHKLRHKEGLLNLLGSYIKGYGTTLVTWLGPLPLLIVSDPQVTQDILNSPHCVNKSLPYKIFDDAVGKGLLNMKDPLWTEHRKMLNPAFGHKVLLSFLPIFNDETAILLKEFDKMADGREMDILPCLQHFTLSIATQTTMGTCVKEEPSFKNSSLMAHYEWLQECVTDTILSPWLNIRIVRQFLGKEEHYFSAKTEIKSFIGKMVEKKLSQDIQDETTGNKNSFLNLAIELLKRGSFDRQNVEDEANILVVGAFETSSKTLANTLMLLAMFPEYQDKVFEEIQALFPKAGDFSVSYEDTQQMVYLDLVLRECMRLIAPVPLVARQTSKTVRLSNGVCIPKGMQIVIDIFHMQRSKDIWGPDADSFNPEHFLPHNFQEKHPYAFIPFTKGVRSCIGARLALWYFIY